MVAFFLTHLRGILEIAALVVVIAAGMALKHSYDEGKRDEGRAEVRKNELKPLQDQVTAAQKRAAEMTIAWDEKRKAADQLAQERDDAIAEKLAAAKRAAATLPPAVAGVIFPAAAAKLFNERAGGGGSAPPAGTAAAPRSTAPTAARPANPARR